MDDDDYLTSGLCPACFCIDFDSHDFSYEPRPVADVVAGCKNGCAFCGLLTRSLNLKPRMVDGGDGSMICVCLSRHDQLRGADNQNCITAVSYAPALRASSWATVTFDISIICNQDEDLKHAIPFLAPQVSASESETSESILERSFDWVRKQLDECTTSHVCSGTLEMPLPTRILELGDQEAPNIRLLIPDEGAAGRYAALSYCWGRSNHFVLTSDTVEDLQNGFHISELPQTLQDAVRVTREIGLRYLWVDALCIIQGQDVEAINDWNIEVAKMDTVYTNAFVTISAAASPNSSGGLFSGSHCDLPFVSSWAPSGPREVALWARATWRNDSPGFKSEPVNSRAWTLQENMFSSRVLFYTSFGLLWKCKREITWVYSGESCVNDSSASPRTGFKDLASVSRYSLSVTGGRREWTWVLELYTARNLTNPYDKLPALAAIAKQRSDSTGAEYLAGLWKTTFRQDLLWKHHPIWMYHLIGVSDAGNPLRSNAYRAPSWSWAAIDGLILSEWTGKNLESSQYTWLAEVITYPVPVLVDPRNPFGGVIKMSTELQMRGAVQVFDVHEYPKANEIVTIRSVKDFFDTGRLWVDDYTESAAWRGRETESLFCLHILGFVSEQEEPVSHQKTKFSYALALLPVHGFDHTYIRVGFADIKLEPDLPSDDPQIMAAETITIL